jgi:CheY-like chemotaxis protein
LFFIKAFNRMTQNDPLRILLIEDRTVAAITLECLLEDLGHTVSAIALTPPQAERALQRHADAIDLVIYDALLVGMPSLKVADLVDWYGLQGLVTSTMPEPDLRALGFNAPYLAQPFTDIAVWRALPYSKTKGDRSAA